MDIKLSFDSSVSTLSASQQTTFENAVQAAATYLDGVITNNATITIGVGWNEVDGQSLSGNALAEGGPSGGYNLTYTEVESILKSLPQTAATTSAYASMPASDPGNANVWVTNAQAAAWGTQMAKLGIHVPSDPTTGYVGFSSSYTFDYSTSGAVPSGEYDFNGIALHELTHALGRFTALGGTTGDLSVLDLFRYTAPGTTVSTSTSTSTASYFSDNGGTTDLANYSTTADPGDWASTPSPDSFDAYIGTGQRYPVSSTDLTELNVMGFSVASALCFAPGTRIATATGEAAVETLRPGDLVRRADGAVAPVRWIGRQSVATRFADPLRSWPVRVSAGALAPNVPTRDLLLSPGHALLVGGVLAQAGALVNGTSIRRESRVPEHLVWWHVELDGHALLLAEGTPAESFLAGAEDLVFDNAADRPAPAPEAEELPYPRCRSPRQLPPAVRAALAARAVAFAGPRAAA